MTRDQRETTKWKWKIHFSYVLLLSLAWLIPAYRTLPLSPAILRQIYENRFITSELAIFMPRPAPYLVVYFFNPLLYVAITSPLVFFLKNKPQLIRLHLVCSCLWMVFILFTFPFR